MRLKIKRFAIITFFLSLFFTIEPVFAHCPLCTAATGAVVAITRWYGVDDSIIGVFIGSFVIVTALWFNNLIRKRNKGKDYMMLQAPIILLLSFVLTIVTFYFAKLIGPSNQFKIFGIDKILFGMIIGIGISFLAFELHKLLRRTNKNKNYLPYQSIIVLLISLAIGASILFIVI